MKEKLNEIIWGKNKFNGVFAMVLVGLVLAGCCGNLGSNTDTDSKNISTSSNSGNSPFGKDNPFSKNTSTTNTRTTNTADNKDDDNNDSDDNNDGKDSNYTKADASKKQVPSDAEMQEIVKSTLLDFNDAVQSADFSDFRSNVSKPLQRQASAERMKENFQLFINGKMDISSIKSMDATFTSPAKVIGNALDVKGEYPTYGLKTKFELQYIPEGKDWKLIQIKIEAPIKKQ